MSTTLHAVTAYPFNVDGPLCPLLNHAELLGEFYAEDGLRHGIKSFCKKTAWPGKPLVSFAISPEKLQELLLSLFNTPAARAILHQLSEADRATYLDNAIWEWFTTTNPKLGSGWWAAVTTSRGNHSSSRRRYRDVCPTSRRKRPMGIPSRSLLTWC